ncbi:MAG: HEAT repeat domain-containing protein [Planctomycetes bacterium]|nr:HEAT repeat domain-containing protein [Planctomycetota bacterium]
MQVKSATDYTDLFLAFNMTNGIKTNMRLLWIFIAVAILLLAPVSARAQDVTAELITLLEHKDAQVRKNTALTLGDLNARTAVKALVDTISDENPEVREAAVKSLVKITKQNLPADYNAWINWWEKEGSPKYGNISGTSQELSKLRVYLNFAFIVMLFELGFILLFIVVFSFMGGSKIKEMKEVVRRAEKYVSDADEVTKRFDKITQELEQRRTELMLFFTKLKEDNQNEIERFGDMLQQNIEHQMRETTRNLREKAEAEIKQTVVQIKQEIAQQIKPH